MRGAVPPLIRMFSWCVVKQWICYHGMVLSYAQGQLYHYLTLGKILRMAVELYKLLAQITTALFRPKH
jgi:hypothetical protein